MRTDVAGGDGRAEPTGGAGHGGPVVVHRVRLVPAGSRKKSKNRHGWGACRAECSCGWKGRTRPMKGEAWIDGQDHRLEARYGPSPRS